ncbi:type II toxin-antitoxin system PemK/MazF family toxin [Robertmurraya siralis]|uniref:type II toxin-antitoxin system PemK/MazF family toxin n=1 Tax=Robertmurraya siralis TaxID=77777 RepID=UPI0010F90B6E|nr:type II toxin-antitoxin system PemK/MazF family toxin [Robertmurraya siralis]
MSDQQEVKFIDPIEISYGNSVQSLKDIKNKLYNHDEDSKKKLKNYLEWITLKTDLIRNENTFSIPKEKENFIRRSYVHWIHFGFNVGNEFGGHHPAVILKETGNSIFVLPLSSGKIPPSKKNKDYCVEIPHVFDLAAIPRWANVLRIVCVSKMRIDFTSRHGRIKGKIMDNISNAMNKSGIIV